MTRFFSMPQASPLRWLLAAAALAAAGAHIPLIGPHLDEAPYMGTLFSLLTVACVALAIMALVRDSQAVYVSAAITCGLAIAGYAATRLVAFPMLADDVGNWLEPLGITSIVSEAVVVVTAAMVLHRPRTVQSRRIVGPTS
ncbi:MAG: hypothetical protein ABJB98_10670 [Actinomycetota bacterium]